MGTSAEAMTAATADQTARFTGSSTKCRNASTPAKANTNTAVVVSLGSQSHHTPHVGFAQIAPWQQRRNPSRTPTSIEASMRASHLRSALESEITAQTNANVIARS